MSDCKGCSEAAKTQKTIELESDYNRKSKEGAELAKAAKISGFFIALSKNKTGYRIELTRPNDSKLDWGYVSIL